jgi:hypothetical protein
MMGNAGIVARALASACPEQPLRRLVDLGGGDGTFLLSVARRLTTRWKQATARIIDRKDFVSDQTREKFEALGWNLKVCEMDLFEWLSEIEKGDSLIANLVLHHFSGEKLSKLFEAVAAKATLLVACEPRRGRLPRFASRGLGWIGCNAVTRHDAVASVRAGFAGQELSQIWPDGDWNLSEKSGGLFSHVFVAQRR